MRWIEAVKQAILLMLNGEPLPQLLMPVIQYCIHTENHELKKLLMYYWEVVQKYDARGELLPEMILVCNALRNDLISPNEFIRGCTLRFLCHITDRELLEPLVPSILDCLSHRHAFVRRNAVLAVHAIYQAIPDLLPDAPTVILRFIEDETDGSARRNAFFMLYNANEDLAIEYFASIAEDAAAQPEGIQLAILELARKVCRRDPSRKSRFIAVIFGFLSSPTPAVSYEAASTVMSLSAAPTAIRATAQTFTTLLCNESDNNVKLIVLGRLRELKERHPTVMQEIVMDILRALSAPNLDIRQKTLDVAMDLISARNVEGVVNLLKKEIVKTQEGPPDDINNKYRALLVQAVHSCVVKFPEVAESVVHLLMDFITTGAVAVKVVKFVREIVEQFPALRPTVLEKLVDQVPDITDPDVIRVALWIIGEYCEDSESIVAAMVAIQRTIGELPLVPHGPEALGAGDDGDDESKGAAAKPSSGPKVLADGTYASQSAAGNTPAEDAKAANPVRHLLVKGNFFVGSVVAATLTKLALRMAAVHGATSGAAKSVVADALLVMAAIVELGQAKSSSTQIDQDSYERITGCMRTLGDPTVNNTMRDIVLTDCRRAYAELAKAERKAANKDESKDNAAVKAQVDQLITVRQLRGRGGDELATLGLDDDADIILATGVKKEDFSSRLRRIHQLTGIADPIYAEAAVLVHDYDITLEMLVVNRTSGPLTDLCVELATVGDLKLVDHPQSYTVPVGESVQIKSNIKVSSTESAHIYGTIVYKAGSGADKTYIHLNDIHIDIMDYIHPATCPDNKFRDMWAEFEWENKVNVNTNLTDLKEFVDHISSITNMRCLTAPSALTGECNFLAANMYARSTFGEDALANVSVELRPGTTKIKGHVRIRSKTQGVALSLGERITARMKV